jgi:L-fuculose-phosphate aldolase
VTNEGKSINLTTRKVLSLRDAETAAATGATRLIVTENCVLTPSARDFVQQRGLTLENCKPCAAAAAAKPAAAPAGAPAATRQPVNLKLFSTPEAEEIKKEICAVGRKIWMRQFVDGNGGNISYRIGPNEVLCTPTLMSKFDLTPEDIGMVDLDGVQVAGKRPRTSEIFMHLEIYKNVPEAKSVVHCHPPHATAYAITGKVPPNGVIPEFEVFVGKVAISPYKTPGTTEFAQTVIPYVRDHNTVLLANHGIVCWADTVTHAEWFAEVLDTYCWTLMNASLLGVPLSYITEQQSTDLLGIKKKLGLPDARFDASRMKECQLADLEMPNSIAVSPSACDGPRSLAQAAPSAAEADALVKAVTDAVLAALK